MGNRTFIEVHSKNAETISLYGHWSGSEAYEAVRNVLEVTDRIGDPSYLTAQLFHEFSRLGNYDGRTGFGIMAGEVGSDAWVDNDTVLVNADTGEYEIGGVFYDIDHPYTGDEA